MSKERLYVPEENTDHADLVLVTYSVQKDLHLDSETATDAGVGRALIKYVEKKVP